MPGLSGRALALTCTGSGLVPSRPPTKKKKIQFTKSWKFQTRDFQLYVAGNGTNKAWSFMI